MVDTDNEVGVVEPLNRLKEIFNNTIELPYKDKIKEIQDYFFSIADGKNIVGDGTEIIHNEIAPLKHIFADQIYVRQMEMKQGLLIFGAIHKHLHVWFLLTGHLTIATGESVEDYEAPCYIVSKPGTQRILYANEDSIFVNIHKNPTNTEDIRELENEIVALNGEDYEEYVKQQKI
tara:strand:+ start:38 stop:565 length:528 start_codon:yes stop_codon:yes gene_type:complete